MLKPIVIAHVSDLDMGAHAPLAVEELVADVFAARPTATVVTGNLTARAGLAQFRQAAVLLDGLPRPRIFVPGDHDLPVGNPVSRLVAPYDGYRAQLHAEPDGSLDLPGLRISALASTPRWRRSAGSVSRSQADGMADFLGRAPAAAVRVLALHHPVWQCRRGSLVGRRRLLGGLLAARVDLVLAGHVLMPSTQRILLSKRGEIHPVIEVVAGTATSNRLRGSARSWALIRISTDSVTVENRYYDGSRWFGRITARYPALRRLT